MKEFLKYFIFALFVTLYLYVVDYFFPERNLLHLLVSIIGIFPLLRLYDMLEKLFEKKDKK